MKTVMAIFVALTLAGFAFADDTSAPTPTPDSAKAEMQARVAAAQARMQAKQAAAAQAAVSDDPVVLRAAIKDQKEQIDALKARVAMLTREIEAMKKKTTGDAAPAAVSPDISAAIAQHRLIDGMTVAQAEKALSLKFTKMGAESSEGQEYQAVANGKQAPLRNVGGLTAGGQITGTEYRLNVKDGVIYHWSNTPFSLDPGTARTVR